MKLKRSLAALLVVVMVVVASGCTTTSPADGQPSSSQSSKPTNISLSDSDRFEQLLMERFNEIVSANLIDCTFLIVDPESYGVTEVSKRLGGIDFDDLDNAAELWQQDVDELKSFNYRKLTEDQQLIYKLLERQSEVIQPVLPILYYEEINSPLLGIQSQLPTLLTEFKFDSVQDVRDYIEMLGTASDYFGDMAEYQRRRSAKGLFMSDRMATSVVDFCRDFAGEGEDCLLIEGFPQRLEQFADLDNATRNELIDSNRNAVLDSILPAYASLAGALEELKGSGTADVGLQALPDGKLYYEYLVASGSGSDWDIKTITKVMDDTLRSNYSELFDMLSSDRTVYKRMRSYDSGEQVPSQVVEELIRQCEGRFPELRTLSYDIKYVHPSQEDNSSPAFYYIPEIDSLGDNTIYINRKHIDSYPTLFSLLGHEGYPGHMYQNNYVVQMQSHPIRRLLDSTGYAEGWAKYVEDICYDLAGIDDSNVVRLMQLNNDMDLLLCARIDIGVNYDGWGLDSTIQLLSDYEIEDDNVAASIYNAVIEEPANYVKYAVGYLEFMAMRDKAETALGDSFDELEYHRTVLDLGSVPFRFVSSAVDRYISDRLIASSKAA